MRLDDISEIVADQNWLEPAENWLQDGVKAAFKAAGSFGRKAMSLLEGSWLGHPLHPVLTDIPIGAWTTALTLDVLDAASPRSIYKSSADAAIALGLGGALGAATTGLTDWQHLTGRSRRIGFTHASLNVLATLLYAGSLVLRGNKNRRTARGLSLLGYGTILLSAYLGGELVYQRKIGVNHAPLQQNLPHTYRAVLADADLPEDKPTRVEVDGIPVVLVRRNGQIYALTETCSHLGGPLAKGTLQDDSIICPWHQSRFALESGHVLDGPASVSEPCFETRVVNGQIEIRAPIEAL